MEERRSLQLRTGARHREVVGTEGRRRYPAARARWKHSPVEHRLFSEISKNLYAHTLSGVKITDERMQALSVTKDQTRTQMELHHPTVLKTGTYFVAGPKSLP